MHRSLPTELSFYICTFLSTDEIVRLKKVNKENNSIASQPIIWKKLLKEDFNIQNFKGNQKLNDEYKNIFCQFKREREWLEFVLSAYLFSREIRNDFINDLSNMETITEEDKVVMTSMIRQAHFSRLENLDGALIHSGDSFKTEFKKVQEEYPYIDYKNIEITAKKIMSNCKEYLPQLSEEDSTALSIYLSSLPAKCDSPITIRLLTKPKLQFEKNFMNLLLHTACSYLNLNSAKILIEAGAEINFAKNYVDQYGDFFQTTPLFEIINSLYRLRKYDLAEKIPNAKALIDFLLQNGADPDMRVFTPTEDEDVPEIGSVEFEKSKSSIRDLLVQWKDNFPNNLIEILDLIIHAPEKGEEITVRPKI